MALTQSLAPTWYLLKVCLHVTYYWFAYNTSSFTHSPHGHILLTNYQTLVDWLTDWLTLMNSTVSSLAVLLACMTGVLMRLMRGPLLSSADSVHWWWNSASHRHSVHWWWDSASQTQCALVMRQCLTDTECTGDETVPHRHSVHWWWDSASQTQSALVMRQCLTDTECTGDEAVPHRHSVHWWWDSASHRHSVHWWWGSASHRHDTISTNPVHSLRVLKYSNNII